MASMTAASIDVTVTGGVDTHSATQHAAALDHVGRLLGTREFGANPIGYAQRVVWLQSFGIVTAIGVEGTASYGAGLTRFLRRRRLRVIEVNRPNRRSRRTRGKSDPLDAESAARRALAGEDHVIPKDTRMDRHDRGVHPGVADCPYRRGEVPHRRLQPAQRTHHHRAGLTAGNLCVARPCSASRSRPRGDDQT